MSVSSFINPVLSIQHAIKQHRSATTSNKHDANKRNQREKTTRASYIDTMIIQLISILSDQHNVANTCQVNDTIIIKHHS